MKYKVRYALNSNVRIKEESQQYPYTDLREAQGEILKISLHKNSNKELVTTYLVLIKDTVFWCDEDEIY